MKTTCLKKQCCQVGHRAVKCSEHGEVSRNSNLRAPQSHDKNDWYSTSWTLNIVCKDSLKNSKLRQESLHVDWWPCVTLVYGLWPLETSKWSKANITAPLLSEARMQDSETKLFCQKRKYLAQKICQTFNTFDSFHVQCIQKRLRWMQSKHPKYFFDIKNP